MWADGWSARYLAMLFDVRKANLARLALERPAVAGRVLSLCTFLGRLLRVCVLLVFLACVDESDDVRIDRDLSVALALAVLPL